MSVKINNKNNKNNNKSIIRKVNNIKVINNLGKKTDCLG